LRSELYGTDFQVAKAVEKNVDYFACAWWKYLKNLLIGESNVKASLQLLCFQWRIVT